MTLWEFDCCVRGWMKAHGVKEKLKPPTDNQFYTAVANARI